MGDHHAILTLTVSVSECDRHLSSVFSPFYILQRTWLTRQEAVIPLVGVFLASGFQALTSKPVTSGPILSKPCPALPCLTQSVSEYRLS